MKRLIHVLSCFLFCFLLFDKKKNQTKINPLNIVLTKSFMCFWHTRYTYMHVLFFCPQIFSHRHSHTSIDMSPYDRSLWIQLPLWLVTLFFCNTLLPGVIVSICMSKNYFIAINHFHCCTRKVYEIFQYNGIVSVGWRRLSSIFYKKFISVKCERRISVIYYESIGLHEMCANK